MDLSRLVKLAGLPPLMESDQPKKKNALDTIRAIFADEVPSTPKYSGSSREQHVQLDTLSDGGRWRLVYTTIYNPTPEWSPIEAYVLLNKSTKKLSFLNLAHDELYIDDKGFFSVGNTDMLEEVIAEFKMESGTRIEKGADQAYYDCLVAMTE